MEAVETYRLTSKIHPNTSKLSAEKLDSKSLRTRIMAHLELNPQGLTCHDIAHLLKIQMNTATSQLSMLQTDGFIEPRGEVISSKTNRHVSLFVITPPLLRGEAARDAKKKKIKPIGNPELFGKMMQAVYAYAAEPTQGNNGTLSNAATKWAMHLAGEIGGIEYAAS